MLNNLFLPKPFSMSVQEQVNLKLSEARLIGTHFILEKESQEYNACTFKINKEQFHFRKAKATPKKEGLFVTFWKRIPSGVIAPFEQEDDFKFLLISVETDNESGFFIFPKSILIDKKIVSSILKEGKRAFRIYPPWSIPKNKQANASQKWQLQHFKSNDNLRHFLGEK